MNGINVAVVVISAVAVVIVLAAVILVVKKRKTKKISTGLSLKKPSLTAYFSKRLIYH
jgi:hypothetical protein